MRELTKQAVEDLYEQSLKYKLEAAFEALMGEIKELPEGIYGQYATNALNNLIQLSAKGVTDLNVLLTEYLNQSEVLYAHYEGAFQQIKELDQLAGRQKSERDRLHAEYLRKTSEYEMLQRDYHEEKGIDASRFPEKDRVL